MVKTQSTSIVPYTADQMFNLVADVERYPEFIPYCIGLRIVSSRGELSRGELIADMLVAYSVFREKFRSQVLLDREHGTITAEYITGPFRNLKTSWRFSDQTLTSSQIDFTIDFEFRSSIFQGAVKRVFERLFEKMADAFVLRAEEIYGEDSKD